MKMIIGGAFQGKDGFCHEKKYPEIEWVEWR